MQKIEQVWNTLSKTSLFTKISYQNETEEIVFVSFMIAFVSVLKIAPIFG